MSGSGQFTASSKLDKLPPGLIENALLPYLSFEDITALRATCRTFTAIDHATFQCFIDSTLAHLQSQSPQKADAYRLNVSILAIANDNATQVSDSSLELILSSINQLSMSQGPILNTTYYTSISAATLAHQKRAQRTLPISCNGYLKVLLACSSAALSCISFYRFTNGAAFFNLASLATLGFMATRLFLLKQWKEVCRNRIALNNTAAMIEYIADSRFDEDILYTNEDTAAEIHSLARLQSFPEYLRCYFYTFLNSPKPLHLRNSGSLHVAQNIEASAAQALYKKTVDRHPLKGDLLAQFISNDVLPHYYFDNIFAGRPTAFKHEIVKKLYETEAYDFANIIMRIQLKDLAFSVGLGIILSIGFGPYIGAAIAAGIFLTMHHFLIQEENFYRHIQLIGRKAWPFQNTEPPKIYKIVQPLLARDASTSTTPIRYGSRPEWTFRKTLSALVITSKLAAHEVFERCKKALPSNSCARQNQRNATATYSSRFNVAITVNESRHGHLHTA